MKTVMRRASTRIIFLLLALAMTALPLQTGEASRAIPQAVQLYLAVDQRGRVSVTSEDLSAPFPIYTSRKALEGKVLDRINDNLLVVQVEDEQNVYLMQGHTVRAIQFDRGYYRASEINHGGNALVIDIQRTRDRNEQPIQGLTNNTDITTLTGRRSCFESAFTSGMTGAVANPVRLREEPFVPQDVNENWIGSLQRNEKLYVIGRLCSAGVWLKVRRESGTLGWAKEWGLSEELLETTFLIPFIKLTE